MSYKIHFESYNNRYNDEYPILLNNRMTPVEFKRIIDQVETTSSTHKSKIKVYQNLSVVLIIVPMFMLLLGVAIPTILFTVVGIPLGKLKNNKK